MTIDEAIEIQTDILNYVAPGDPPEEHDAIQLGIEALLAWRQYRNKKAPASLYLLPGETE